MAIRAVASDDAPKATTQLDEVWVGALGTDGDEGGGLTTAAILSFLPRASPGTWYSLSDFSKQVSEVDWQSGGENEWTSLEIKQSAVNGDSPVLVEIKLVDAVKSLCLSAVEHLSSFKQKNIWVRFE